MKGVAEYGKDTIFRTGECMKTLILNGSPRKNGDTAFLIDALISHLHGEYRVYDCYSDSIFPCIDCRSCRERLFCPVDDEMQHIYAYLSDCDNIIIASPVHYAELSAGLLKAASRFQVYSSAMIFRHEKLPLSVKRGAVLLAQGGSGGAERAYETARLIFQGLGISEVYPLVCSQNTDKRAAAEDGHTRFEIQDLVQWLNAFEKSHESSSSAP